MAMAARREHRFPSFLAIPGAGAMVETLVER